jgi:hypothetical protein
MGQHCSPRSFVNPGVALGGRDRQLAKASSHKIGVEQSGLPFACGPEVAVVSSVSFLSTSNQR